VRAGADGWDSLTATLLTVTAGLAETGITVTTAAVFDFPVPPIKA
jgi:hypothetical protein